MAEYDYGDFYKPESGAAGYRNGLLRAAQIVRAALDGAPEPEWEYGVVGVHGQMVNNGTYQREQTHRRRKAGPWLPVPGVEADDE